MLYISTGLASCNLQEGHNLLRTSRESHLCILILQVGGGVNSLKCRYSQTISYAKSSVTLQDKGEGVT